MVEDEHEHCASEDVRNMTELLSPVKDGGCMHAISNEVESCGSVQASNDYQPESSSEELETFRVLYVAKGEE